MAEPHKRPYRHAKYKTTYRVKNWREYEPSLRDRGEITLWISLVVRFVSPYQVKLTAAGKALVNREAARIAWDEDSSKLAPGAAGAGCD